MSGLEIFGAVVATFTAGLSLYFAMRLVRQMLAK